jgi:hypothetical protein
MGGRRELSGHPVFENYLGWLYFKELVFRGPALPMRALKQREMFRGW